MKVFCDLHHEELFESLRILFEDRFGFELYRPVGREWFDAGFWKLSGQESSINQYLTLSTQSEVTGFYEQYSAGNLSVTRGGRRRYLNLLHSPISDGIYYIKSELFPNQRYKAITLDAFRNTRFDILIATIPGHIVPYQKLISLYQNNAKLIFQMGNDWTAFPAVSNILNSTAVPITNAHHINYNQEFALDYSGLVSDNGKRVFSLTHALQDTQRFLDLEYALPSWTFKMHGVFNRDPPFGPPIDAINEAFKSKFSFLWHVKKEGEGWGYNVHRAMAYGRPIILDSQYVKNSKFFKLMRPGINCIDIGQMSTMQIKNSLEIAYANYSDWHINTKKTFVDNINYDEEFVRISNFINNLV